MALNVGLEPTTLQSFEKFRERRVLFVVFPLILLSFSLPFSCLVTVMTAIEEPAILPDTFSGRTTDDFSIWHSQFELAAVANGWTTSPVKLQMIVLRLRGPALRAYHALPPAERSTYNKTVHQLRKCFSPTERASVHRATLRAQRRRPDESLAELADDISLLVARAYPDLTDTGTIDQLVLDAFVDSLDPQLKRRVRDADPSTLAGAVRRALVLDAYDEANRRTGPPPHHRQQASRAGPSAGMLASAAAESEDLPAPAAPFPSSFFQDLLGTQQRILQSLDRLALCPVPRASVPVMSRSNPIVCFSCGEEGHMRSGCPKRGRTSSAPRGPARSGARSVRDATHPHSIPPPSSSSSHSLNRR